jgi:hypothetical protein
MLKVDYTREIVVANKVIFKEENFSSIYFENRGNTSAIILDNVTMAPGEKFVWENIPVNGQIVLISSNISIVFIPDPLGVNTDNQMLVLKTFYV